MLHLFQHSVYIKHLLGGLVLLDTESDPDSSFRQNDGKITLFETADPSENLGGFKTQVSLKLELFLASPSEAERLE